jgi:hypothetical protein
MQTYIFWNIMPCSPLNINGRRTHRYHLQGQRVSQARNQHEAGSTLRQGYGLKVFRNGMLRRIFGSKREEATRGWRKLYSEELYNL